MRNYKLFLGVLMFSITPMFGQGYYDDDIYYDAEKAKKERQEKLAELQAEYELANPEMKAPTYQVYNNNDVDVDAYNRMGRSYTQRDSSAVDSIRPANSSMFTYTDRIERFSNPDIVTASDDPELIELYYADDVNIYVGTPSTTVSFGFYDPWYSSWYSPWYGPRYSSYWYSPFYTYWGYGYWDPWCSWYDPFWGPGYYHPYPYYGYHHHYYPSYAWNSNHRYSSNGRRPFGGNSGSSMVSDGRRPVNSTIRRNSTATGRRPSSTFNNTNNYNQRTYNGYRGGSVNNNNTRENDFDFNYSPSNSYRRGTTTSPSFSNPTNRGNSGSFRGGSTGGGRGSFGGSGGGRGGRR